MKDTDIHQVYRLVKREIRKWKEPVVGVVAKETQDPFQILIACLLSLRTKDLTTAEASQRLFLLGRTPYALSRIPLKKIEQAIYPVGFYRTKAKQIHDLCEKLIKDFGGKVPDNIQDLLTLKGVGRKTANLVVTVGFQKPGICVDIHVHRISNRWGYVKTQNPDHTEQVLRKKLPHQYWITFNDLLVPFGQYLCRPISPFCSQCPLTPYCKKIGVTRAR